ncbi:MAG: S9 family peptidase [Chlamydiae bacterium]|nr:S9 family peptidase [Chlamydiota bacterium]
MSLKSQVPWSSPITSEALTSFPLAYGDLQAEGGRLYWTESRPSEKGRSALMMYSEAKGVQEKYSDFHVQTRVHEYGGGAFLVTKRGLFVFDLYTSTLYQEDQQGNLSAVFCDPHRRVADFSLSPDENSLLCVCEDHTLEVKNVLLWIDLTTKQATVWESGEDFYASPRFSPDGKCVAFLSWSLPHMPWEECSLTIRSLDGTSKTRRGAQGVSLCQFSWVGNEDIVWASDEAGFWQLYRFHEGKEKLLCSLEADFANAPWTLGKRQWALCTWQGHSALFCSYCQRANDHLVIIPLNGEDPCFLACSHNVIRTVAASENQVYWIGGSSQQVLSVMQLSLSSLQEKQLSQSMVFPESLLPYISFPHEIQFRSSWDQGEVFGWFYPPYKPAHAIKRLPPLIIRCHGGPTSHAVPLLGLDVQFWTSRGFAWLDVNYRGSTGYGKHYRDILKGLWGIVDVQDCLDGARYLILEGLVDPRCIFAKGSSSGGLTALLLAARGVLSGCVSAYGVTDLSALAKDTHKFECGYLDSLIGGHECYQERSPSSHPEKITCPVLFLHGEKDCVVPIEQARTLCERIAQGSLVSFPEEGHSFKQSTTIQKCLDLELAFYEELLTPHLAGRAGDEDIS